MTTSQKLKITILIIFLLLLSVFTTFLLKNNNGVNNVSLRDTSWISSTSTIMLRDSISFDFGVATEKGTYDEYSAIPIIISIKNKTDRDITFAKSVICFEYDLYLDGNKISRTGDQFPCPSSMVHFEKDESRSFRIEWNSGDIRNFFTKPGNYRLVAFLRDTRGSGYPKVLTINHQAVQNENIPEISTSEIEFKVEQSNEPTDEFVVEKIYSPSDGEKFKINQPVDIKWVAPENGVYRIMLIPEKGSAFFEGAEGGVVIADNIHGSSFTWAASTGGGAVDEQYYKVKISDARFNNKNLGMESGMFTVTPSESYQYYDQDKEIINKYAAEKNFSALVEFLKKRISENYGRTDYHETLAWTYVKMEKWEEALKELEVMIYLASNLKERFTPLINEIKGKI